jgi:hypothetical protein
MDHRFLLLPAAALVIAAPALHATTYLSADQARELMFPGLAFTHEEVLLTPEQLRAIAQASGVKPFSTRLQVWRGAAGELFIVDEVLGRHEFITFALGLDATGAVKDVEILQYNESYGDEIRNAAWRAQFTGKQHGATLKLDKDIQNISAATLSCKHITEGVKRLLATYALVLGKPAA